MPKKPECPGIVISALRGGSGKTIFSAGIIAALKNRGVQVAPFKKGPDYIDAGWLSLAAGRPCYNLDTFLIDPSSIINSYQIHTRNIAVSIVEGNRGLYDCIDIDGMTSTAELAKLLHLPILLCLDVTKTTRTTAAVVAGCRQFDPDLKIAGVLLNRVAGARHERIVRDSIEKYCGIPVLGAVPKLPRQKLPERHMGLVPTCEHQWAHDAMAELASLAENYLDIPAIVRYAGADVCLPDTDTSRKALSVSCNKFLNSRVDKPTPDYEKKPRIGVIRDSAFQFYYPENLEALTLAGAELVITSPLSEDTLPEVDALYIGGGFPETHATRLAKNTTYREHIRQLAAQGLPIYAECGGLMFLGKELVLEDGVYPMTGVLPIRFGFSKRPQGHGYTIVKVVRDNPFFEKGQILKGHEFHYSSVLSCECPNEALVFDMQRGSGLIDQLDGISINNVFATYTHIHALGFPQWATALVEKARHFRQNR
ncbi:MAG: cobyrinate a,c-diamide synthase [Desulfobacteraceae bacterium]|nr:cobyrinate a,c-diamide synthase [Desulfobacteraceae bacterium]